MSDIPRFWVVRNGDCAASWINSQDYCIEDTLFEADVFARHSAEARWIAIGLTIFVREDVEHRATVGWWRVFPGFDPSSTLVGLFAARVAPVASAIPCALLFQQGAKRKDATLNARATNPRKSGSSREVLATLSVARRRACRKHSHTRNVGAFVEAL